MRRLGHPSKAFFSNNWYKRLVCNSQPHKHVCNSQPHKGLRSPFDFGRIECSATVSSEGCVSLVPADRATVDCHPPPLRAFVQETQPRSSCLLQRGPGIAAADLHSSCLHTVPGEDEHLNGRLRCPHTVPSRQSQLTHALSIGQPLDRLAVLDRECRPAWGHHRER
eukprot:355862-Chlamydomonas_euryale.AAC.5